MLQQNYNKTVQVTIIPRQPGMELSVLNTTWTGYYSALTFIGMYNVHQKDLITHLMNREHQSVKMKFNGANGIHYYSMSYLVFRSC